MKLLIVGAGNMGVAYAKALLHHKVVEAHHLALIDKAREKQSTIQELGLNKNLPNNLDFLEEADIVLIAVKPQESPEVFEQLRARLKANHIVISIMAGVSIERIKTGLSVMKIVRAMPNLPLLVGKGMTVYTAVGLTEQENRWVNNILAPTGECLFVENEAMIDAATAVSGSGPAYVFYFMQQMMTAAEKMNFNKKDAYMLSLQTFKGAIELLDRYDFSCEEWVTRVSSKGGTTERAITHFQKMELPKIIEQAMFEALKRSKELSK